MMDRCGDVFELVMHEMIFTCDLPAGHEGPHRCTVQGTEENSPLTAGQEAPRRRASYSASWDDEPADRPHAVGVRHAGE